MIWNPWKEIRRLREEMTQRDAVLDQQAERIHELMVKLDAVSHSDKMMAEQYLILLDRAEKLNMALQRVASEEKPTSNATVKRMARIARDGLK